MLARGSWQKFSFKPNIKLSTVVTEEVVEVWEDDEVELDVVTSKQ